MGFKIKFSTKKVFILPVTVMLLGAIIVSFQNMTSTSSVAQSSVMTRFARLERFNWALRERRAWHAEQGAVQQDETSSLPYPHTYPHTWLIDPRVVLNQHSFSLERYANYLARINAAAVEEGYTPYELETPPTVNRPAGYVSPEDFAVNKGSQVEADTEGLNLALKSSAKPRIWLTHGRTYYINDVVVLPSNVEIASDGTAGLKILTGPGTPFNPLDHDFTTHKDQIYWPTLDYSAIKLIDVNNVWLHDFRIQMADDADQDPQPALNNGVNIRHSNFVRIEGIEFLGFGRAETVIEGNSSTNILIADNLFHGSFTMAPCRQTAGVTFDGERREDVLGNPINSDQVLINGNFVMGMMMAPGNFYDTTYPDRAGEHLGYETDGFTMSHSIGHLTISNNTIMDVGEAIDSGAVGAIVRHNYIERAYEVGLKLIHGAQDNLYAGNRVIASGMTNVVIASSATGDDARQDSFGNQFYRNELLYSNAFNYSKMVYDSSPQVPAFAGPTVYFMNYSKSNRFYNNYFDQPLDDRNVTGERSNPSILAHTPMWAGSTVCTWPSDPSQTPEVDHNLFWKNTVTGVSTNYLHLGINSNGFPDPAAFNSNCLETSSEPAIVQTTTFAGWVPTNVTLTPSGAQNYLGGMQDSANPLRMNSSSASIGDLSTVYQAPQLFSNLTMTLTVRRGTNSQLMLREQNSNWYAVFNLTGPGSVSNRTPQQGLPIQDVSIVQLSDDWYQLSVRYVPNQLRQILTIRQLAVGTVDLGEFRLDRP